MTVASEHALASEIGVAMMRAGGNAVDAAIATTIAVGTLNPYHSCIGGGGFAIVRDGRGEVQTIDFRVTAPSAATAEFYLTADTSHGGSAVGVPGEVRGLAALHARHGALPWPEVLKPSIQLARDGMPMGRDLYDYLSLECPSPPSIAGSWLASDPEFVAAFTRDGVLIPVGERWFRPEYARTLEAIAADPEAFYKGAIADAVAKSVQERGGLMTVDDIKAYQPIWREPLSATYGGFTVYAPPAPASGAVLLSALQTLDIIAPPPAASKDITEVETAHKTVEALRLAYGQRNLIGDPAFVPGLDTLQAKWLAPGAAKERAARVGDKTNNPEFYLATEESVPDDKGTSHIASADTAGVMCSITTTIGQLFASRIMVPGTGIMLNDSMDDFSVPGKHNHFGYAPSAVNTVAGGKRPLSSQSPYAIANSAGKPAFVGGSAGGATIISANVQVIRNLIAHGMGAREALSAPRLHTMATPGKVELEGSTDRGGPVVGWSEDAAAALRTRGHNVEWIKKSMATPCCIHIREWEPAGDPRKYDAAGAIM